MISNKICKLNEFDDESIWYKAICPCGCDESLDIEIEKQISISKDNQYPILYLRFYKNSYINIFSTNWFSNILERIRISFKILIFGKYETTGEYYIQDVEHIEDFIKALEEGKEKLKIDLYKKEKK